MIRCARSVRRPPILSRRRLFWFAGQGGFGIMVAPTMAQAAALIATSHLPAATAEASLSTDTLSPTRFR